MTDFLLIALTLLGLFLLYRLILAASGRFREFFRESQRKFR